MRKISSFTVLLFFGAIFFLSAANLPAQKKTKKIPQPEKKIVEYVGVESVTLEKDSAFSHCPNQFNFQGECSEDELQIRIKTIAKGAEENGLNYYYFVTGGKIIGEGANVVWDLTKIRIGNHSITVALGKDSVIKGKTVTKTLKISECPICDLPCNCPILTVEDPKSPAKAGDGIIFTAKLEGKGKDDVEYIWTVSNGTIEAGQGTNQIIVRTEVSMKGKKIVATVEIGGLCGACESRASAIGEVEDK